MSFRSVLAALVALALISSWAIADEPSITFKRTQLDSKFRSEGCAVGDFNH